MRRGAILLLPLLFASLACPRAPRVAIDPRAPCASLDARACESARALTVAASTYADEFHDYLLVAPEVSPALALERTKEGWRPLPLACARARASREAPAPRIDAHIVDYAFVGVSVDATLVSADADIGPLLARSAPATHEVSLVAVAFVRDLAPPSFDPGAALVETPSGGCACEGATSLCRRDQVRREDRVLVRLLSATIPTFARSTSCAPRWAILVAAFASLASGA